MYTIKQVETHIENKPKFIYRKTTINRGMHVIKCPDCGNYCASACDREMLPEWSTCDLCYPPQKKS